MSLHPLVPLGEVCTVNPRRREGSLPPDLPVSFVPMAAIDQRWGEITDPEDRPLAEVARGYSSFQTGDVLFAKITPCMENGKVALAGELTNRIGRGSTEFFVLRPAAAVLGDYLFYYLRQARFRAQAKQYFTGTAGQQRVPKSFMENALIPLPPLDEQRRIVATLNRAAKIERLHAQATERLREFVPALFLKMFGDPTHNSKGWQTARVGDVCEVQGGLQVTRKRAVHPLTAPYLRVANVLRDKLVLDEIKSIRLTERELQRVRLLKGDLLIVEGHGNPGEIGRLAVWDGSIATCVHQNHLIRVRPDPAIVLPSFACAYLNSSSGRLHLLRQGKTTSGLNTISASDVKSCPVFVPPIELQRHFAQIVDKAHQLVLRAEVAATKATTLTSSLMARLLSSDNTLERDDGKN